MQIHDLVLTSVPAVGGECALARQPTVTVYTTPAWERPGLPPSPVPIDHRIIAPQRESASP